MTKSFSQRELCEYFGWNYQEVARQAKLQGLSTRAYVQQKTGWILDREKYYPPSDYSAEVEANYFILLIVNRSKIRLLTSIIVVESTIYLGAR